MRHRKTQTHWPSTQILRVQRMEGVSVGRNSFKGDGKNSLIECNLTSYRRTGQVIPSVLSSQLIILVDIPQAVMSHATLEI